MLFCCQVAEIINQALRKGVQSFWIHCCDHCCTLTLIYLDGERFCLLLGVTAHFNNYSYLQAGIHKQPEAKQTATTQVYVISSYRACYSRDSEHLLQWTARPGTVSHTLLWHETFTSLPLLSESILLWSWSSPFVPLLFNLHQLWSTYAHYTN